MSDVKLPWWKMGCGDLLGPADRLNKRRFNLWLLAWAVSFVIAMLALRRGLVSPAILIWPTVLAPTIVGLLACAAYVRFLRQADELFRKIQLEGLAFGFGLGSVFMVGWALAEAAGAPRLNVSDPLVVMFVGWTVGQWVGAKRYR